MFFPTGKIVFPVRKTPCPVRKARFPVGKFLFPVGKATIPIGKVPFLVWKSLFPVRKPLFPVRKASFPTGKAPSPTGKLPFNLRKNGQNRHFLRPQARPPPQPHGPRAPPGFLPTANAPGCYKITSPDPRTGGASPARRRISALRSGHSLRLSLGGTGRPRRMAHVTIVQQMIQFSALRLSRLNYCKHQLRPAPGTAVGGEPQTNQGQP